MKKVQPVINLLIVFSLFTFVGCASVPKEVVQLSYQVGEDLSAIEKSYKTLVHNHFDMLRKQRMQYLNDEWTPKYIRSWVDAGRLREVAKGDVVWSEEKGDFIEPVANKGDEMLLKTVTFWSLAATAEIEGKRAELIEPLNKQEEQLIFWLDDAFNRLYRGNATITAHLNSLRKVQEVQDESLAALHLKDLTDKINNALITASDKAQAGLEEVRKTDGFVKDVGKKIQNRTDAK